MGRSAAWQAGACTLQVDAHAYPGQENAFSHASTTLRFYASTLLHPYASTMTTICRSTLLHASTLLRFYKPGLVSTSPGREGPRPSRGSFLACSLLILYIFLLFLFFLVSPFSSFLFFLLLPAGTQGPCKAGKSLAMDNLAVPASLCLLTSSYDASSRVAWHQVLAALPSRYWQGTVYHRHLWSTACDENEWSIAAKCHPSKTMELHVSSVEAA